MCPSWPAFAICLFAGCLASAAILESVPVDNPLSHALRCLKAPDSPTRVVLLLIPRTASRHLSYVFKMEHYHDLAPGVVARDALNADGTKCDRLEMLHTKPMTTGRMFAFQGSRLTIETAKRIKAAVKELFEIHLPSELAKPSRSRNKLTEMFLTHGGKEYEFYLSVCSRFRVKPDPELVAVAKPRVPSDSRAIAQNLEAEQLFGQTLHAAQQRGIPLITVVRDPVEYLLSHYGVKLRDDQLPVPEDWQSEFHEYAKMTQNINAQLSFLVGKRYFLSPQRYESVGLRLKHVQSANETDFESVRQLMVNKHLHALTTERFEVGIKRVAAELQFSGFDVHAHALSEKTRFANKHDSRKHISAEFLTPAVLADIRSMNSLDTKLYKFVSGYDMKGRSSETRQIRIDDL